MSERERERERRISTDRAADGLQLGEGPATMRPKPSPFASDKNERTHAERMAEPERERELAWVED